VDIQKLSVESEVRRRWVADEIERGAAEWRRLLVRYLRRYPTTDGLADEPPERRHLGRAAAARRRIVEGTIDYLHMHIDRPIYTEDLCSTLGVSVSALAEAFQEVVGTSPHRFLKLRRLALVRAVLLDRERGRPLIKSVALSHGFWHLGQFAQDYRETFGETPSETVTRVCGSKATE
jgi:AraC-like DNA-binding protein